MTDIALLQRKIKDSGLKIKAIAEKSGILRATLYNRMKGTSEFTASEIMALTDVLNLTKEERDEIFFAEKVDSSSTSENA